MARNPVCIGCGQATGPVPRLNRHPDGRVCTSCRDRLMDSLPPVLPTPLDELSLEEWADEAEEDPPDDFLRGA